MMRIIIFSIVLSYLAIGCALPGKCVQGIDGGTAASTDTSTETEQDTATESESDSDSDRSDGTDTWSDGEIIWSRASIQWNRPSSDVASSVALSKAGNIYIGGYMAKHESSESLLLKLNPDLEEDWTYQFTSNIYSGSLFSVAVDSQENIYMLASWGRLAKVHPDGIEEWTAVAETNFLMSDVSSSAVAIDNSDNVYFTGYKKYCFNDEPRDCAILGKYTPTGSLEWSRSWGVKVNAQGLSIAVDGDGNIYVTGTVWGSLNDNRYAGSSDVFLRKFTPEGTELWTAQWGTRFAEQGRSVVVDSLGYILVGGRTGGSMDDNSNAGNEDIFVTKLDSDGIKLWTFQVGTPEDDTCESLAVNEAGEIYLTGHTRGKFGQTDERIWDTDVYLAKLSDEGDLLQIEQWGTYTLDEAYGIVIGASDTLYVVGGTWGDIDDPDKVAGRSYYDAFLSIIEETDE
ncbi:MAG: hypothetical protein GY847_24260 [Proteobacteria bacterium]|nr:hypothetical protein [Pseudomonadota bacterium]